MERASAQLRDPRGDGDAGRGLPAARGSVRGTPYAAFLRLGWWAIVNERDLSGRCALKGIEIWGETLDVALDIIYALILDDRCYESSRVVERQELDRHLASSLEPERDSVPADPR